MSTSNLRPICYKSFEDNGICITFWGYDDLAQCRNFDCPFVYGNKNKKETKAQSIRHVRKIKTEEGTALNRKTCCLCGAAVKTEASHSPCNLNGKDTEGALSDHTNSIRVCLGCGISGGFIEEFPEQFRDQISTFLDLFVWHDPANKLPMEQRFEVDASISVITKKDAYEIGKLYLSSAWCADTRSLNAIDTKARKTSNSNYVYNGAAKYRFKAIECFTKYLKTTEIENLKRLEIEFLLAEVCRRAGCFKQSVQLFEQIIQKCHDGSNCFINEIPVLKFSQELLSLSQFQESARRYIRFDEQSKVLCLKRTHSNIKSSYFRAESIYNEFSKMIAEYDADKTCMMFYSMNNTERFAFVLWLCEILSDLEMRVLLLSYLGHSYGDISHKFPYNLESVVQARNRILDVAEGVFDSLNKSRWLNDVNMKFKKCFESKRPIT